MSEAHAQFYGFINDPVTPEELLIGVGVVVVLMLLVWWPAK